MLANGPGRSGPEVVGDRSDTVPDVLAVGPGICHTLFGAVSTGGAEADTVGGDIDHD